MWYITINKLYFQHKTYQGRKQKNTTKVYQEVNSQRPSIEKGFGPKYETDTEKKQQI